MTRVMVVVGAYTDAEVHRKVATHEIAEADMVIGLNEECSDGRVVKDRYGKNDVPVKVVNV